MSLQLPLVSIVTPCYNAGEFIRETIESVLAQSYTNWEMLIVDDCSTDKSSEIIKHYVNKDSRIRYFRTSTASGSPSLPRNIAIDHSKGDYIAFLDADDIWMPEKLEKQLKLMIDKGYAFIYSDYEKIDYQGNRNGRFIKMPIVSSFWDVIETCSIPCLTVILSRSAIAESRFKSIPKEDFVFWLDILKKGFKAYNTGEVLALYREQHQSRSSNKIKMIRNQWLVLRQVEGVKPLVATYFMTKYLIHGFVKYLK